MALVIIENVVFTLIFSLKKKQADSISEMSEQMDQLNKMKAK